MQRTVHDLRCMCRRQPLLAVFGVEKGQVYVHMKVYKNRRIFGEVVITGDAKVKIHCRECFRWYTVLMTQPNQAKLVETEAPDYVDEEPPASP